MPTKKRGKSLLAQRREELGYTQKTFADRLRVYDRTVQRWESENSPGSKTPEEMLEICKAYEWTLEELAAATANGSLKPIAAETAGSYGAG
mgnify:CR=1 FL=1